MRNTRSLQLEQLEQKLTAYKAAGEVPIPPTGWIKNIRSSLNMTMEQLGRKLGMTRQGVRSIEERESSGSISIKTLKEVGNAMDMQLVYGFIPKDGSMQKMIKRKANELAQRIVLRTNLNMVLEDQGNGEEKIKKAIEELAEELEREMRKALWD